MKALLVVLAARPGLCNDPERREGALTSFSSRNAVRQVCKPAQVESEIAYAERRVKPLAAAPTLRYGPAGDSAPWLRLKAAGMAERFPFGPFHGPKTPVVVLYDAI